ncbi:MULTISPECIES: hypothetical protein [unclassified Sphingomonas]|uniref:hypothetical protein n=1 Tax=unclassified Sphingomonas TaxID=196159 RepID=UPI0012E299DB|nr:MULTISPECIES: hypothetical protein [unclassified Sphingomonas]MBD8550297.1 hypothetical protein [Sphingomonas sp. CFBP 8764]
MTKRHAVIATTFLIGVANAPAPTIQNSPAKVQATVAPLPQTKPDRGCLGKPSDRSSELCAQWSAVDVSAAALKWSEASFWLGIIGALLGLLTTVAAFLAARYAKKAFQAAEVDLRPWMQFSVEPGWASGYEAGYTAATVVKATNIGRTPAIDVSCIAETFRYDNRAVDDYFLPFFNSDVFTRQGSVTVSLLPGENYTFQVESVVPNDDTKRIPTIGIKMGYRLPNGVRARTCRAYHTAYCWDDPNINPNTGDLRWPATEQRLYVAPVNVTT